MSDTTNQIVIIGAGHAGVQVADSLRSEGHQGNIVLLDSQQDLPYQRPALSKDFITLDAEAGSESLPLRARDFYQKAGIELHLGSQILKLDRAEKSVLVQFADQRQRDIPYDTLVLATGAEARTLDVPGVDAKGIFELRTQTDATAIRQHMTRAEQVVVVGAGFIGLEFAAAARSREKAVTVVEFAERPMTRALSEPLSLWMAQAHRAMGTDLRCGVGVKGFHADHRGNVSGVVTQDDELIEADMVVMGVGVIPRTALAETAGLEINNGIAVDATLQTSDPSIYAIGDCGSFPFGPEQSSIRLESVQNATDQARHVARTIVTGSEKGYSKLPVFWSHQGSVKLQIAGLLAFGDEPELEGDPSTGRFSVRTYRGSELAVVESVNQPKVHMEAKRHLGGMAASLAGRA